MTPRSIRRAAERKALKKARKAERPSFEIEIPETAIENTPIAESALEAASHDNYRLKALSEARLRANRANALRSTGPVSELGKAKVSLNATKTALTGRTVLLPSDDTAVYELHLQRFTRDWQPIGDREGELVQILADAQWRLNRIPSLEMAIYALARVEFAGKFQDYEPATAAALIEAQAFITYHRQLNNLSIQEARLRRQFEKDSAELLKLQKERADRESQEPPHVSAPAAGVQSAPSFTFDNGFEFPSADLTALEDHLGLDSELPHLPKAA